MTRVNRFISNGYEFSLRSTEWKIRVTVSRIAQSALLTFSLVISLENATKKRISAEGFFLLGKMYQTQHRFQHATRCFRLAARCNHKFAQTRYALALDIGMGTSQSTRRAFKWFLRAAHQGIPTAQFYVAKYALEQHHGINFSGIDPDLFLRSAAAQGHKRSMLLRGMRLFDRSPARALAVFCAAAENSPRIQRILEAFYTSHRNRRVSAMFRNMQNHS